MKTPIKNNLFKNFATPLAIEGTKEQLEALVPKLKELGYKGTNWSSDGCPYLLTDFADIPDRLDYNQDNADNFIVSASNPELVLALAAMVKGDEFHVGEIVICHTGYDGHYTEGKLYKILSGDVKGECVGPDDRMSITNGFDDNNRYFRKATKEEILSHFAKQENNKNMSKKIKGYKFKPGMDKYLSQATSISGCMLSSCMLGNGDSIVEPFLSRLKEAGVLDIWFEPVYEEFKVGDWVTASWCDYVNHTFQISKIEKNNNGTYLYNGKGSENCKIESARLASPLEIASAQKKTITVSHTGGSFNVQVSSKGIFFEGTKVDAGMLQKIYDHRKCLLTNWTVEVQEADFGCKRGVKMSSIKEILDAYNSFNSSSSSSPDPWE